MGLRVAKSADELAEVLLESRVGFDVTEVPSDEAADWRLEGGAVQHRSGGFFSVNGFRSETGDAVLLFQPQAAVTGVLMSRLEDEPLFMLQARAEPGCLGEAQFGPTVQSTPANYMQVHGGSSTPHIDAFIRHKPDTQIHQDTSQLDLGKRYFVKTKRSILAESAVEPTTPNYIWANHESIRQGVLRDAFFNIDLRSILAIAPWSEKALIPVSESVRRSARATIRPDAVAEVFAIMASTFREHPEMCALTSLSNWQQTNLGWSEIEPRQGFSIGFFKVRAEHREVAEWTQPLVNCTSEGCAALASRERDGVIEFFVRVEPEIGLATKAALVPSYLRYPGEIGQPPNWFTDDRAVTWSETIESDEGGRFYCDASRYTIKRVDEAEQPSNEDGVWLRVSELKFMLTLSNLCSIQLRGLISQLIGVRDV